MFLRTGGTTKLIVKKWRNVGIGLTNPSSKLTIETDAGDGTIELLAVNAATTKNKIIFSEAVLGDESFFIEHDGSGAGADNLLKIHGDGSGGTASGITIRRDGRVGIGTDSPDALVVKGGSPGNIDLVSFQNNAGNETHRFYADSANDGVISTVTNAGVIANLIQSSGDSYFNGGNVGIGTTSPVAKLDVEAGPTGMHRATLQQQLYSEQEDKIFFGFKIKELPRELNWNNNTFKIIAKIDSTSHQSINFVNDTSYF